MNTEKKELTSEQKAELLLQLTKKTEKHLQRIANNVAFFFYLIVFSMGLAVLAGLAIIESL